MAKGGYGRGAGIPLRDRVRVDPSAATAGTNAPDHLQRVEDSPEPAEPLQISETGPGRHCWITAPVDGGDRRPGLLLEWRKTDRWEGRVYYAALLRPGRWGIVEEWLPAEALSTD